MKKSIFLFFAAILCAIGMNATNLKGGEVVLLKPSSNWKQSNARFAVYFFNDAQGKNTWVSMTKASDETDIYYAVAPTGNWEKLIFCRMDPGKSANDWGSKWNQSGNCTWTNAKSLLTVPSNSWDNFTTSWSVKKVTSKGKLVASSANVSENEAVTLTPSLTTNTAINTIQSTTYTISPATGASVSGNTFTATAAGTYTVTATIKYRLNGYTSTSFESTVDAKTTITVASAAEPKHDVKVTWTDGTKELQSSQTLSVGESTGYPVEAPEFKDYTFSGWTLGSGVQSADENANPISITTKASGEYTLVANYDYIEPVIKTIYCKMEYDWWTQASAAISAYISGTYGESTGVGSLMTLAPLEGNVWKIDVDVARYQKIRFIRVNPEGTSDWGARTGLVEIPTDDKNLYTITQSNAQWSGDCPGTWSVYEAPATAPKRYITGNKELVGGEGWKANEIEMTYDNGTSTYSHTFLASALTAGTEYKLKVTEGNWDGGKWGTINGTIEGVSNDGDGNVCFKLSTVGDVTVTFDGAKITVSTTGTFYIPKTYEYYIAGDEAMTGFDWNNAGLGIEDTDADGVYSHVFTNLAAGTYNFRITDGTWTNTWGWNEVENKDFVELSAGDNDNNIKLTLTVAKTVTVNYHKTTKKVSIEGLTPVTYSDITIKAYTESAAPQIWWWNGGSKCPDADKTDNPSNPGNKYAWETAPTMTAVAGEANWYEYTFKDVNDYTGICFKFKSGDKSSSNFEGVKENKCYDARDIVNAKTTECGVTPSDCLECSGIYLKGTFNSWGTDHEFMKTADADVVTTTVTITQEGSYNFKVHATDWLGNDGGTMARGGSGVETGGWTMEKDKNAVTLAADMEGDYIFTYTISTKKLTITFPVVVPQSFPNQPTTLYFYPCSDWKKGNERYAAYIYNNGADKEWINLIDANNDGIYELANPQKYAKVIICRMDKTKAENKWENKWDQVESGIEIPNTAGDLNTCMAFWTNAEGNRPVSECTWVAPTLLTDANWADFVDAYKGKKVNALVKRTFKSGQNHTLCLPFNLPTHWLGEGAKAYQLSSIVSNSAAELELMATECEMLYAGKPYIVVPVKGSEYEHLIVSGVTVTNASAGNYTIQGGGYKATMQAIAATPNPAQQTDGSTEYWIAVEDGCLYKTKTNKLGLRAIIKMTTTTGAPVNVRARVAFNENVETGVEDIITTDAPVKVIENGQLIIIRDGVKYNVQGQKL